MSMSHEQKRTEVFLTLNDFYISVQERIHAMGAGDAFAVISIDIDDFNYINDLFGYEAGDQTLKCLREHFASQLDNGEFFANSHNDNFLFCLNAKNISTINQRFIAITTCRQKLDGILPKEYSLIISGGAIIAFDMQSTVNSLIDKANLMRKRAKGNDTSTIHIYDEKVDEEIKWQKLITYMMESALNNREIQMYLQPKALISSGDIIGAEALARWVSPQHGMIYPDKFIPIMEKTGFVRRMDFFMLDEACCFLARCKQEGKPTLPISVNFSKSHLNTENLVERIFKTVNNRGVSTHLIEIEFTESLSSERIDLLANIISDLKLLGFKVSLDDFGNAYSSLTCLKDLPIDIIKIDKGFLDSVTNNDKGKMILAKMVELIKSLRMLSVAEGVEEEKQLDFLQKLSCDIGQGYYYAKPMPLTEYEKFIENSSILSNIEQYVAKQMDGKDNSFLQVIPQEFQMDNWELYTLGKNIDMGLMKGFLDGDATVQYINDRALEYLGYSRQEFRDIFNNSIVAFTHPDDAALVQENTKNLVTTGKPVKYQARAIRKDGQVITLQGRSSCVIDSQGRPVGIYAFQDVTEDLAKTEEMERSLQLQIEEQVLLSKSLLESELRYKTVLEQSDDIMFDWDFSTDTIFFTNKYEKIFGNVPLTDNITTNQLLRQRIHPDDLPAFETWINDTFCKGGSREAFFRIIALDDSYIQMRCRTTSMYDDYGNPTKALGVFSKVNNLF